QVLLGFSKELATYSHVLSSERDARLFEEKFLRLLDGLETFAEGVSTARVALRLGLMDQVRLLEADLVSILKDLFEAKKSGRRDYVDRLLTGELPENLREWHDQGIPAIIRSR